jgi:hypothetical protein
MRKACEVDGRLKASVPERLGDILPCVVGMIAARHVATSCQLVRLTSNGEQPDKQTTRTLAACSS